jgi:HD-like signal output (HDOD) protein
MTTIKQLIQDVNNLKPISAVANKLLAIVDDPDYSMGDIAKVVQYDPIITASVLQTCNSAFFGLANPAESIEDAVKMMGIDQVVEIVLLKAGRETLGVACEGYGLEKGDMWRYSVSAAVIAKQVAVNFGLENINTIFTSALLKDVGKIILEKYVTQSSEKIKNQMEKKNKSFREAEKIVFGIDHTELGAIIAKIWKLSPRMVNIIRHHHLADNTMIKDKEITSVYLSDCICMIMGIVVDPNALAYRFKKQKMNKLGMTADDISKLIVQFDIDMQGSDDLLDIV